MLKRRLDLRRIHFSNEFIFFSSFVTFIIWKVILNMSFVINLDVIYLRNFLGISYASILKWSQIPPRGI